MPVVVVEGTAAVRTQSRFLSIVPGGLEAGFRFSKGRCFRSISMEGSKHRSAEMRCSISVFEIVMFQKEWYFALCRGHPCMPWQRSLAELWFWLDDRVTNHAGARITSHITCLTIGFGMSARDQRLYFLIQLVAHRLKNRADGALQNAAGLSTSQATALSIVAAHDGITQNFIAQQLSQRESAITTMTDRLLKADYISRAKSNTDGRAWELRVTQCGRDALEKVSGPFSEINALLDGGLKPGDAKVLGDMLTAILESLDK